MRTDFDYRLQRGDGSWMHVHQTTLPLDEADGSRGSRWYATIQDVTTQKLAEAERERVEVELVQHRQHLEELVAERSSDLQQANMALADAEAFLRTVADNLPARVAYWTARHLVRLRQPRPIGRFGRAARS